MTDAAIIAASYAAEKSYTHNPDDVIDASDAVGAWGTAKESTTELSDLSGNGNIADIYGAMPTEGFIQGRRFDGVDDYLDCGNDSSLTQLNYTFSALFYGNTLVTNAGLIGKISGAPYISLENAGLDSFSIRVYDGSNSATAYSAGFASKKWYYVLGSYTKTSATGLVLMVNGIVVDTVSTLTIGDLSNTNNINIGRNDRNNKYVDGIIAFANINPIGVSIDEGISLFNTFARLPFWSVNYTDYPDNVAEYTDNLPYSSSIISSGTFKVDDDKLQCVSAGTMTYSASYEFDGSEYIKVEIDGVEYAGTGTITHGNTTVSVAQGSNKVTIQMGTGDTIEGEIGIQFREEV